MQMPSHEGPMNDMRIDLFLDPDGGNGIYKAHPLPIYLVNSSLRCLSPPSSSDLSKGIL
jgi:hypothetical protein